MKYIAILTACDRCADPLVTATYDHSPTRQEIRQLHEVAGDKSCLKSYVLDLSLCDVGPMKVISID